MRPGSRTKVSVPLVPPQTRHPERSAALIYSVTQRLWRVEDVKTSIVSCFYCLPNKLAHSIDVEVAVQLPLADAVVVALPLLGLHLDVVIRVLRTQRVAHHFVL